MAKKLKTKYITIEVETALPNKAFTRIALQAAFDLSMDYDVSSVIVRQITVSQAQAPKK